MCRILKRGGIPNMRKTKALLTTIFLSTLISFSSVKVEAASSVERLGGDNRYDTAVKIAKAGWKKSDYAVIASGGNFPDALSSVPLAKKYDAPILLTEEGSLNKEVAQCLKDLKVSNVFIVGGVGVVSANIEAELKAMNINVQRIAGDDRYSTSIEIAKNLGIDYSTPNKDLYVVSGENFPDALSIAAVSAKNQRPIILVEKDKITANVENFIKNQSVNPNIYVVGGSGVIKESVFNKLTTFTDNTTKRISGSDRYETNVQILKTFSDQLNFDSLTMASGENFPDALAGVAYGAKSSSPLLIVNNQVSDSTLSFLSEYKEAVNSEKVSVFGGQGVVNDAALKKLKYIDTVENSFANYNNQGVALKLGNYIYYKSSLNGDVLYRMNLDGTNPKKVLSSSINGELAGSGDEIYADVAGAGRSVIYTNEFKPYWSILQGYKVYFKDGLVYSSDGTRLYLNHLAYENYSYEIVNDLYGENNFFYLDSVYFKKASAYGSRLYKQNLTDKSVDEITDTNIKKFNIYYNKIYFISSEDNKLYKSDLDGKNKSLVIQDEVYNLNVTDGWIYYSNLSDEKKLYKIKIDGTSKTKLNDISTTSINVIDNWIFYYKDFDIYSRPTIYRMKTDGTGNQQV